MRRYIREGHFDVNPSLKIIGIDFQEDRILISKGFYIQDNALSKKIGGKEKCKNTKKEIVFEK
jgi:hypothetical protein